MFGSDVQWSIPHRLRLFICILTLSNEHAYHVEVSVFAGPPHVLESLLAVVTLAKVEGKLVLSAANFAKNIIVSLPLEKGVTDARVAIISGVVKRCPLAMVLSIDVGSMLKEQDAGFETTALACKMQWCALQVILPLHLCLIDEKSLA